MQTISNAKFRAQTWTKVYEYAGHTKSFQTFACSLPHVTMTHERRRGNGQPMRIYYTVMGRTTDSPTQAVRYYNEEAKAQQLGGRRKAPGSVETLTRRRS